MLLFLFLWGKDGPGMLAIGNPDNHNSKQIQVWHKLDDLYHKFSKSVSTVWSSSTAEIVIVVTADVGIAQ